MNTRVQERIQDWGSRPFSGGHAGLRDLADEEFSGVVETTDGPWLCLLNGTVVGLFEGRMADLSDADGTAYVAPDPALPLLFAMWEQGGTLEEQYYTNDTPISEADVTLSSGSFSGYIELSENVLSGDYYLCYYGDRSMNVAFVGSNERLVTGDDAFERADDEVGIYDVYSVDLTVVDVPEPESARATGTGDGGGDVEADTEGSLSGTENTGETARVGSEPGDASRETPPPASREQTGGRPDRQRADDGNDDPLPPGGRSGGSADSGRERSDPPNGGESSDREDAGTPGRAREGTDPTHTDREERESDRSTDPTSSGRSPGNGPREDTTGGDESATERGGGNTDRDRSRPDDAGNRDPREPEAGRGATGEDDSDRVGGGPRDPDGPETSRESTGDRNHDRTGDAPRDPDDGHGERRGNGERGDGHSGPVDTGTRGESATGSGTADPQDQSISREIRRGEAETDARSREGSGRKTRQGSGNQRPEATDAGGRGSSPTEDAKDHGSPRSNDGRSEPAGADSGAPSDADPPESVPPDRLRERIRDHEAVIERLEERLATLEAEGDERGAKAERLRDRVEDVAGDLGELRRTVMRLDRTVESLEAELDGTTATTSQERHGESSRSDPESPESDGRPAGASDGSTTLQAEEALAGTTLLVRYSSRGDPTLKSAHAGDADRPAVDDNLRLETKTSFDASATRVDGRPFREFLTDRLEYRCFEWLVRDLLYEIRDTGNADALQDLYDAIPRIDRAEFGGEVVPEEEDADRVTFDLVVRDDRENPLIAMNFHESRDPASAEMVEGLQTDAEAAFTAAGLGAAFLVTTCYFDGAARESAESATGGRLLSRNSKKGYVSVSRKRGFHLCLVDVSDGDFHLKVPEL